MTGGNRRLLSCRGLVAARLDRIERLSGQRSVPILVLEDGRIIRDFMEAFGSGDVERTMAFMTDDCTWWVAGSMPLSNGRGRMVSGLDGQDSAMAMGTSCARRSTPATAGALSAGNFGCRTAR